jgi:hypothetical protein
MFRYAMLLLLLVLTTSALAFADERGIAKVLGVITAIVAGGYLVWLTRAAP